MSEFRIAITLSDNDRAAIPKPRNQTLYVGDTVIYVTDPPNLPFRVEFKASPSADKGQTIASPFANEPQTITDSSPHSVIHKGKFECRCFITPNGKEEVGWRPDAQESGGEHDVRP